MTDDFMLTPHGYRHKGLIRTVKGGSHIRSGKAAHKVFSATGELMEIAPRVAAFDIQMPVPPDGWQSYTDWQNGSGSPVTVFETSWRVPPAPKTQAQQTIFLFNSIMDPGGTHILQPVLQWGPSAAPGSVNGWAIASWWVGQPTDPCFITELIAVNAGDTLLGRIQLIGQANGLFSYNCEFDNYPGARLTAENLPELTDCTETLEVYNVKTYSDYPSAATTAFSNIVLTTAAGPAPLQWAPHGASLPNIVNGSAAGGEVDIVYPHA